MFMIAPFLSSRSGTQVLALIITAATEEIASRPIRSIVSRLRPQRSTATLAALPAMSLVPFAPLFLLFAFGTAPQ
jgi:hypothetical protein